MKGTTGFWNHDPSQDYSWYWRKLNGLKDLMSPWYDRGVYSLTNNGEYSVSNSYVALLGHITVMREANLIQSCIVTKTENDQFVGLSKQAAHLREATQNAYSCGEHVVLFM